MASAATEGSIGNIGMTQDRWAQLQAIFHEVVDLDEESRAQAIRRSMADASLQAEVEALVREYDSLGNLLNVPETGATAPEALQAGDYLLERFHIVRLIGRGGMGEVYEARDSKLNNEHVALKTLRPDAVTDPRMMRMFLQEVLLARDVNHPNVCPAYDVFDAPGSRGPIRFVTMKLISGESLKDLIEREAPLSPNDALRIAAQIAAGLDAAHGKCVVHGDLKPANVMVEMSGQDPAIAITDFGLARRWGSETSTQTSAVMGTPAYMAPEQISGRRASPASDVYSFGVILRELVAGSRNPSDGVRLPPRWRAVCGKCTDSDPSRRYRSAGDAVKALRPRPLRAVLLLATALAVVAFLLMLPAIRQLWEQLVSPLPATRYVAVLPLETGSAATLREISQAVSDDVSSVLSRHERAVGNFWVVPANDIRTHRITTAEQARHTFQATLVVRGVVRRDSRNLMLKLELVDTASGKLLRSREAVCPVDEIFRLSEYAANEAATMLNLRSEPGELKLIRAGTRVGEAYRHYEAGRIALWARTPEATAEAIRLFQMAIDLDQNYALAYAKLAEAYTNRHQFTKSASALELAERSSMRARELAPSSAAVHVSAAIVHSALGRNQAAVTELQRALEIESGSTEALVLLARAYQRLNRPEEAEAAYQRVIDARPNYWAAYNIFGAFHYSRGKYAEAEKLFRFVTELAPTNVMGYNNLGGVYVATGRCRAAIQQFQKSIAIRPSAGAYTNLGNCYFRLQQFEDAARAMEQAVKLAPAEHVLWRNLGDAYQAMRKQLPAREAYREAVKVAEAGRNINPSDPHLLSSLALYRAKLGDLRSASDLLRHEPIARSPDLNVQFRVALTLELCGRRSEALHRIQALLKAGFSRSNVMAAPELARLREDPTFQKF